MTSKEFVKLSRESQQLYVHCLKDTRDFLKWIGKDMLNAADEVDGLVGWFQYLMKKGDPDA